MSPATDAAMPAHDGFAVWDGVYANFAEAPAEGPGFDGSQWCARSVAAARQALAAIASGAALDYSLTQRNVMLPPVVATLLTKHQRLRLLDFGGGPGLGYLVLKQALGESVDRVDYTIVDGQAICAAGAEIFGAHGPAFRDSIAPGANARDEDVDIVHAASVLQYVEHWQGTIAALVSGHPRYLSVGDVFAGAFPAYVTLQDYYGSRIRHWMFNLQNFIGEVAGHGYRLAMQLPCHVEVLGRRGPLPMNNLPAHLRIPHTHHLLFVREGEAK